MSVAIARSAARQPPARAPIEPPFWYSIYGLPVRSDIRLPVATLTCDEDARADFTIRRIEGKPCPVPDGPLVFPEIRWREVRDCPRCQLDGPWCDAHGPFVLAYRGPGGTWVWHEWVGMFYLPPDSRRIDAYPEAGADERVLGMVVASKVVPVLLQQLGYPSLHASAIVTRLGAVGFLGPPAQGKSTIAAGFMRRGTPLLSDDALPLRSHEDGVYVGPGLPVMKVWNGTAVGTLELPDDLPSIHATYEKKVLELNERFATAASPTLLRALYVLERYDPVAAGSTDCSIRTLAGREGLVLLPGATLWRDLLRPGEEAALLPLYVRLVAQAPVRVLRYPHGFEHQAAVEARILEDLEVG